MGYDNFPQVFCIVVAKMPQTPFLNSEFTDPIFITIATTTKVLNK